MKTLDITNDVEARLDELERAQVEGRKALEARNRLVVEMVGSGYSQAEVFHRLNQARARVGVRPLTRDAVFALLRRASKASI